MRRAERALYIFIYPILPATTPAVGPMSLRSLSVLFILLAATLCGAQQRLEAVDPSVVPVDSGTRTPSPEVPDARIARPEIGAKPLGREAASSWTGRPSSNPASSWGLGPGALSNSSIPGTSSSPTRDSRNGPRLPCTLPASAGDACPPVAIRTSPAVVDWQSPRAESKPATAKVPAWRQHPSPGPVAGADSLVPSGYAKDTQHTREEPRNGLRRELSNSRQQRRDNSLERPYASSRTGRAMRATSPIRRRSASRNYRLRKAAPSAARGNSPMSGKQRKSLGKKLSSRY